ncbi:RING finger protein 32 [Gadus macrocephalus]|uniref:RING finger protein 32 n=1 Tax=Gadus macrocephalus TaxID=80720 RepID=UPI0028CB3250|nr:RING finger protein 32 [Gadus macrocephalus]
MTMQKRLTSKNTNLVITSVAFQDHISRSLLEPPGSVSRAAAKSRRNKPSNPDRSQVRPGQGDQTRPGQGDQELDREYVVDDAPARLTLAQRLGLVAAPAQRLTGSEWSAVKSRCVRQGDSASPCAICREEFCLQPQVLLSCSHVFHRACLQSYERFCGRKCCPMCRKEQYETRVIHDAAFLFRQRSATRIQACWRGYLARRWYRQVRKTTPPRDRHLRRKFFEEKLQELNTSLLRCCQADVEGFLWGIDRSLSSSRRVFQQLGRPAGLTPQDWDSVLGQAQRRGTWDCPICLTPVFSSGWGSGRGGVLLSCSHLFHPSCLDAFESFGQDRTPSCPLCRSSYSRRPV